jgi:hypothetical protein
MEAHFTVAIQMGTFGFGVWDVHEKNNNICIENF